ncbi:lysine/ornithine N-monooxygenase [Cyathus striatus]|nr:lysine/ornithine N-monooxygenase [Cyathus striatus]
MCVPSTNNTVFDLIGLGFGPANIAIGAALTEAWSSPNSSEFPVKNVLFLEKHDRFRWHPGMLLPDARMQISFMKDLATLRSPQSPYTFLSYLHSQNRLITFINRGSTIPTRKEYADYLAWAAQRVQDNGVNVKFSHQIVGLNDGKDNTIQVHVRNLATGEEETFRTRDLIISPGGSPKIPTVMLPYMEHPKVVHSSSYCLSVGSILDGLARQTRPLRVAVIGSGQSAAEVTLDLRQRLGVIAAHGGRHEIDMIIRKGSLKPSDDSPFANEIFDPATTDKWFNMPSKRVRESTLSEYKATNYGVVNPRTIEVLYEVIYDQKLDVAISKRTGVNPEVLDPIINILPYTSIASVEFTRTSPEPAIDLLSTESSKPQEQESFLITSQHSITREVSDRQYDAIIYATGYQRTLWVDLLKSTEIGKHFGLTATSSEVHLTPCTEETTTPVLHAPAFDRKDNSGNVTPISSSAESTPPTSPEPSMFNSTQLERPSPKELRISRSYRLLPVTDGNDKMFEPRVYLQGVEEATHGLSDTLLSVLGVRAGEVVADLCSGRSA